MIINEVCIGLKDTLSVDCYGFRRYVHFDNAIDVTVIMLRSCIIFGMHLLVRFNQNFAL